MVEEIARDRTHSHRDLRKHMVHEMSGRLRHAPGVHEGHTPRSGNHARTPPQRARPNPWARIPRSRYLRSGPLTAVGRAPSARIGPSFEEAIELLARASPARIVVVPYFLSEVCTY
jgi:hypothetical protein